MKLTTQQVNQMKAQGLSTDRIRQLSQEQGYALPSEGIKRNTFGKKVVGTLADITGTEKLGQGLAYTLFRFTPEYKWVQGALESGEISPEEFTSLTTGDITTGEVVGSAIRTAGTALSAGTLGKAKVITAAKPFGNIIGTARKGAMIGAGIGGVGGSISGIKEGRDLTSIGTKALGGALGGAVVGAGAGALGGAVTGGGFAQGAIEGAKLGAKSGALYGGTRGFAKGIEEERDIQGLTAEAAGGAVSGGIGGAIFGGLIGGVSGSVQVGLRNKAAAKAEENALMLANETLGEIASRFS